MKDEHKERQTESTKVEEESDWETREEIDTDAVSEGLTEYLKKPTRENKSDRYYWTVIHSALTLGSAGLWLIGLIGYYAWKCWSYAKHNKEVYKTYEVKKRERKEEVPDK